MASLRAIPPAANNSPAPPSPVPPPPPPLPNGYKLILLRCIWYAIPAILGLLMVIFLAIPALMPPEFSLDPGSSLSSLNISTSHVTARWDIALSIKNPSKLIAVEYADMKLFLSFGSGLALSLRSLIPTFTQGPRNVTTVRAEAPSTIAIVNNLSVKALVSTLKGGKITIDLVAKANRRLHLVLRWVPVLNVYFSCMGVTFTAPINSASDGDWMILGGTLSCTPDIITLLW